MISFAKAFETVMNNVSTISVTEKVVLQNALYRVLAEDIIVDRDIPPFHRVAMDGYACRRADLGNALKVVGSLAAGYPAQQSINEGECIKVMTGCMLPPGADMIIMVEHTEEKDGYMHTTDSVTDGYSDNIAKKGEDLSSGTVVIPKGTRIEPKHMGTLASVGCSHPEVFRTPKVGIIATGDEIIEPSGKPEEYQIRNANSYELMSQIERSSAEWVYFGIASDTTEQIDAMIKSATEQCDIILISGGVSMGDFDLVPAVLKQNMFDILFDKVAIKPGRPSTFAVSDEAVCFGMPGNPVTTYVIFEMLVRPFIAAMMRQKYEPVITRAILGETIKRRRLEREEMVPVSINSEGFAYQVKYHGSGHFTALVKADGFVRMQINEAEIMKGTTIDVRQI